MKKIILAILCLLFQNAANAFYIKVVSDGKDDSALSEYCERMGYKETVDLNGKQVPNLMTKINYASTMIAEAVYESQVGTSSDAKYVDGRVATVSEQSALVKIEERKLE